MRRMLDPKEVGGSVQLYNHFVRVGPKDGGEIFFNYTSTDEIKLTKETILSAIADKSLICQGYVKVENSAKTPEYVYVFNNEFRVKWIDLTTLVGSTKAIDIEYFTDKVSPVL